MPYLGNPAQQRFSSPRAASVYSGDGSTVAFTLEEVVSTDEDVLVSVDGVIQEPSVAYAVSSGTTLTFTAAPSNNAGNNIFVYYIARTFGSVSMPDGQNVNAANFSASGTGAITGAATVGGTLGVTGAATVGGTLGVTGAATVDGNINLPTANTFLLGAGHNVVQVDSTRTYLYGGTDGVQFRSADNSTVLGAIDNLGQMTLPLQPAFLVQPASDQSNIAEGSDVVVIFGTERFDNNADFASNVFTAPVTGKYLLTFNLVIGNVDSAPNYVETYMTTSNRQYASTIDPRVWDADALYWAFPMTVVADMDASDTAQVKINIHNGGTVQADIVTASLFSGALIC